jgi:TonB family protein
MQEGRGGDVLVAALVGEKGKVTATYVAKASAQRDLQQAACDAIRQWRFPKLEDGGKPISYVLFIPMTLSPE